MYRYIIIIKADSKLWWSKRKCYSKIIKSEISIIDFFTLHGQFQIAVSDARLGNWVSKKFCQYIDDKQQQDHFF